MKKQIIIVIIGLFMSSCARTFTPYKAANTGGKSCSRWNSIK